MFQNKYIKHMRVEADHPDVTSPQELYNRIQDVHAVVGSVVRPAERSEMLPGKDCYGVYKLLCLQQLKDTGIWSWANLISYRNAMGRPHGQGRCMITHILLQ